MGSAANVLPVIAWDYRETPIHLVICTCHHSYPSIHSSPLTLPEFAPNAQKARNLLHATEVPYVSCEQPFVLPRPILTDLGITYRRIPVISIGKDVYCDNSTFLDAIQRHAAQLGGHPLKSGPHDRAFETWGYRSFWSALPLVDEALLTDAMQKDREALFPVFTRKDYGQLHMNALSEWRSLLTMIENDFLGHGQQFIAGTEPGVADIHAMWMVKWSLQTLSVGQDLAFSKEKWPKVWRWIEGLPKHDAKGEPEKIEAGKAKEVLFGSEYIAKEVAVDTKDPLGMKTGEGVEIEASDAAPGTYPQKGTLVGLNVREAVVELENGLRLHFPRQGYIVKRSG